MARKTTFALRFMKATSKLQMFLGPATRGTTEGEIVYRDDAAERGRQKELGQWEIVRNADGSTYLNPRTPQR